MLNQDTCRAANRGFFGLLALGVMLVATMVPALATAAPGSATVTVRSPNALGAPIGVGYRWILEEDTTYHAEPGTPANDTQATNFYRSYSPVAGSGHSATATTTITIPDTSKHYLISVLPDQSVGSTSLDCQTGGCFTMSGKQILPGQTQVLVVVSPQPVPTAQMFVRAFEDTNPLNNTWDDTEAGLGGFPVFIYDSAGQMNTDTYGNPLGTVYNGLNPDGTPHVAHLGDGTIHTMTEAEVGDPQKNPYGLEVGEALVKNIAPGKYGVRIVPPYGEGWQQTSTIEGTPGQDTWLKAAEPRFFAEFGPAGHHAEFGFVKDANHPTASGHYPNRNGNRTISGTIFNQRMTRPSDVITGGSSPLAFSNGHPLPGCWVGLNDSTGVTVYAAPCDADSNFTITRLQPGRYDLVVFDQYLDLIFNLRTIDVTTASQTGLEIPTFRWYSAAEHWVFNDLNENGQWDPGESGIPDQTINFRFRDGSIYQSSTTDTTGYLPFDEIFPFFSWLVAEVDFARFKATGVTIATDAGGEVKGEVTGGEVKTLDRPGNIGHGHLNPQLQNPQLTDAGKGTNCDAGGQNCQTRTECSNSALHPDDCAAPGPVLLEGFNAFIGTTNVFEWGKKAYAAGENGGITGVVYYQTTRAENDPRFAAPETWEPGIPRVQVALYRGDASGNIQDTNGQPGIQLADVDNYPFGFADGGLPGPEDEDHGVLGSFDMGDAIEIAHTDSWDDNTPTDCPGNPADSFHDGDPANGGNNAGSTPYNGKCYDGLRNYQQVRPAVFDGGYAFGEPFTDLHLNSGYYVVQASPPPGYEIQREQDKNVDFGDAMTLSPQALPPICVGGPNVVPDELALFPGVESKFAGETRPLCDRRLVLVSDGKNAAADFFMFTEVPVSGHIQGFVLNDLANEFDPRSPNFGEKYAPSFIPVSVRDYAGNEVYHTTTDAWGTYNAIVPTAFRINTPMPSGVSPNMLQVCLNSPTREDPANPGTFIPDPFFNKQYTQFCYTLNFQPGQTTFLDTPVLPIAAYTGPGSSQLDCDYPSGTPIIYSVASNTFNGPVVGSGGTRTLTITSVGTVGVPDPNVPPGDGNNAVLVDRDFGFGAAQGTGSVTLNGVALTPTLWSNAAITVSLPASGVTTGQLVITRGDTGLRTVHAVTVVVGADPARVHTVQPGTTIQSVLDDPTTRAGDIVLVPPGNYSEMLVMTKPVQLQGSGAGSTTINAVQSPTEKLADWRVKVNYLANCSHQIGLLDGQGNNTASGSGPCGFTPGTGLFSGVEGPGVLVAPVAGSFNGAPARIDGFTITGADQAAGIFVNGNARFLEISNNVVSNNQGGAAAGIRIGHPTLLAGDTDLVDANNDDVNVHHNQVRQNGGLFDPGAGIGVYNGSDRYRITSNYVCGNFAQGDGGGIAHYGRSPNGLIADNKILFNQSFDQTVGVGGNGGGILIAGHEPQAGAAVALSAGSGPVQVLRNLIQGNNSGSGDGGGIALRFINGQEVATIATGGQFESIQILNNRIVNNVTGLAGGGIALQDALNAVINNNTIANNDSTATGAAALDGSGNNSSAALPAGIVSRAHSAALNAAKLTRPAGVQTLVGTYSRPTLSNDIILGNRSMLWSALPDPNGTFPPTGQMYGTLADAGPPRFWDLAVLGVAGTLTPTHSRLTTASQTIGGQPACPLNANVCSSGELAAEEAVFVDPYRHADPTGSTIENPFLFTAAPAFDEGGNFIDVHFGPLTESAGDYRTTESSCAAPGGASFPAPAVTAYVSSNTTGNATSHTVAWPATVTGNRLVAVVVSDGNRTITMPAGFTSRGVVSSALSAGVGIKAQVFDYTVGATPPTGNFTVTLSAGERIQVRMFVISGHDAAQATQVATGSGAPSLALPPYAINYATMTPSWGSAETLWLQVGGAGGGNAHATISGPSGYTSTSDISPNLQGVAVTSGYRVATGASESPASGSFDGLPAYWVSMTIAVKKAGAAGASPVCGADTVGGNLAPVITNPVTPTPTATAFLGVPFTYQVVAYDPNGDVISYSLTGAPAGMAIDALGTISWPTPAGSGTTAVTVTANDGHGGVTSRTLNVQRSTAPATPVTGGTSTFNVNTNEAFVVGAPGVLQGDTPSPLTAVLAGNLAAGGSVAMSSDGSFTFTPNLGWVGTSTFSYRAINAAGVLSAPATVTLNKRVAITDATYDGGTWAFSGFRSNPAQTLVFRRSRNANQCTSNANCPQINGGAIPNGSAWTFTSTGGAPNWQPGDTIRVYTSATINAANLLLQAVPVTSRDERTAPNSTAYVQCPGDTNGNALQDAGETWPAHQVCRHLGAGDGFIKMADGLELYTFGFNDLTGQPANLAIDKGILNAQFPAPTLKFKEGDDVYLTLTNVGMLKRPDLFDPHSVHFHGFPNAGAVFDGVPEASIAINMGFSFTYYYRIVEPGTFMYHCHVEAAEHMQMGMLGNLYVEPRQNGQNIGGFTKFVYNDGDGSTGYDVEVPIQIGSMDSNFHIEHLGVQPLPFAEMHDDYPMLNGRGYPDTVDADPLPPVSGGDKETSGVTSAGESSQVVHTRIEATAGQRVLLRISNLNVTRFYTLATTGLPMKVVGTGAHILRGPGGIDLSYGTSSVTLGGGESADVLIDTAGVAPGTYLLYSTNLEALSNAEQDFGGMMTEIVIH